MSGSLTVDLRDAYRQAAAGAPEEERAAFAQMRVLYRRGREERAASLFSLVLLYRAGPRQIWGPLLLDLLAPALLIRLQRLRQEPPFMDEEDVRQQLVVELLQAAAKMPLPENPNFLRSRLLARTNQEVRRKLAREHRRQARQSAPEAEL